jgi:hypothetical protein
MPAKRSSAPAQSKMGAAAQIRKQLIALVKALPEAEAKESGGQHLSLEVRGKRFGWYLFPNTSDIAAGWGYGSIFRSLIGQRSKGCW